MIDLRFFSYYLSEFYKSFFLILCCSSSNLLILYSLPPPMLIYIYLYKYICIIACWWGLTIYQMKYQVMWRDNLLLKCQNNCRLSLKILVFVEKSSFAWIHIVMCDCQWSWYKIGQKFMMSIVFWQITLHCVTFT